MEGRQKMMQDDKGGDRGLEWSEKDDVIYEQPLSSISFSLSSFVCLCKLLFENCVVQIFM